jgi:hypothetical protein
MTGCYFCIFWILFGNLHGLKVPFSLENILLFNKFLKILRKLERTWRHAAFIMIKIFSAGKID